MTQSYETGKAMVELGAKQPHELLLMLGGVLAILLSVAIYGIQAANQGIQPSQYSTVATTVVINVVLGGALWASAAITRKNLMNGAIVAGVISIILIYFGGQPGRGAKQRPSSSSISDPWIVRCHPGRVRSR